MSSSRDFAGIGDWLPRVAICAIQLELGDLQLVFVPVTPREGEVTFSDGVLRQITKISFGDTTWEVVYQEFTPLPEGGISATYDVPVGTADVSRVERPAEVTVTYSLEGREQTHTFRND